MKSQMENSEKSPVYEEVHERLKVFRWLLKAKATFGIRNWHFWIIIVLFIVFAYVYYGVLSSYHDIYIILFFYPLLYAAIVFRLRGVIFSGLVFLAILLPHALVSLYDPVALTRSLIFALFAFLISSLCATLLNHLEYQVEAYEHIMSLNEELKTSLEHLRNTQQQLIQVAKLGAIGELAASVAHELNNPLTGVLVYTKLLEKKIQGESFNKSEALGNLAEIESAINHCSDIIKGLLDFARQSPPLMRPVTISRSLDKTISLVGHQAKMKNIKVIREDSPTLPLVIGDFNQLLQVFINLTVNAIQAMNEGGRLTIGSGVDAEGRVKVSFQDTGCGISEENMGKLFTPFFTTKEDVKGVGLGLAVSHGIIERHGGQIEVESQEGKGSTFTVYLPAHI
jgi:signal transduction histidine kinase